MTQLVGTDGMLHPPDGGLHDHHAAPDMVSINDTTTTIPPGSTVTINITLPRSDYQIARIGIHGPQASVYATPANAGYEGAFIQATTVASDAIGNGARSAGATKQYPGNWSKQAGDSILTDYIFDSTTGIASSQRRIAVQDCWIVGAQLRFVMHNRFGGSATVWMKGAAFLL